MTPVVLDVRTVLLSFVVSNALCAIVMGLLWTHGRKRFPELGFWLANSLLQFASIALIALRGLVPDSLSVVVGNGLGMAGVLLLYIGLQKHTGAKGPQGFNWAYLAVFVAAHSYLLFVHPSLPLRTANLSLAMFIYCSQCADLLLRRVSRTQRPQTRPAGLILLLFALVSWSRIFTSLTGPAVADMLRYGLYDTLVILTYQMLIIGLTLALSLLVTRRLLADREQDIRGRLAAEAARRASDEKFAVAFHNIPDAIVITEMASGAIAEANEGFFRLSGYSKDESLGRTTLDLRLWHHAADRKRIVESLRNGGRVQNLTCTFRRKSGECLPALASFEVIRIDGSPFVLTVVRDVTEQKNAERRIEETATAAKRLLEEAQQSRQTLLSVIEDQQMAEASIQKQIDELRRWQAVTLDREDRILELKREVNDLAARLGRKPRYDSVGDE